MPECLFKRNVQCQEGLSLLMLAAVKDMGIAGNRETTAIWICPVPLSCCRPRFKGHPPSLLRTASTLPKWQLLMPARWVLWQLHARQTLYRTGSAALAPAVPQCPFHALIGIVFLTIMTVAKTNLASAFA